MKNGTTNSEKSNQVGNERKGEKNKKEEALIKYSLFKHESQD